MNREIRTNAKNLRAIAFKDAVIWLPGLIMESLADGEAVIAGRRFENCLLHGPAVFLAVSGVVMDRCNLGYARGDTRNLILRPGSPTSVVGAIGFKDCNFIECDFDKIGFTGPETFLQSILSVRTEDPA